MLGPEKRKGRPCSTNRGPTRMTKSSTVVVVALGSVVDVSTKRRTNPMVARAIKRPPSMDAMAGATALQLANGWMRRVVNTVCSGNTPSGAATRAAGCAPLPAIHTSPSGTPALRRAATVLLDCSCAALPYYYTECECGQRDAGTHAPLDSVHLYEVGKEQLVTPGPTLICMDAHFLVAYTRAFYCVNAIKSLPCTRFYRVKCVILVVMHILNQC